MTAKAAGKLKAIPAIADASGSFGSLYSIRPVAELIGYAPSTRYYGSKRKLLPWIFEHIRALPFNSALDAFGGTGSVSQLMRAMRKQVVYHDAFVFNGHGAAATLSGSLAMKRDEIEAFLSRCEPTDGVISRNFPGIFFLPEENRWIDGFMAALSKPVLDDGSRCLLLHLLYQACLKKRPFNLFHRSNLAIRTRTDVKRSFGNATTWDRSFADHILQGHAELERLGQQSLRSVQVLPAGDVMDLTTGHDLVYLDPPYVSTNEKANRDGYWRRYHFLEGLAKYDEWADLIDHASPIKLMKAPEHFDEWASKKTSQEKLFELIRRHKGSTVVLSYVQNAYPTESEIKNFFESQFDDVSLHLTTHSHALSHTKKRELLFVGRPK